MPELTGPSLLIHDSWPTFKSKEPLEAFEDFNHELEWLTIPVGRTKDRQPLDCFGFGPWKAFIKQVDHHIFLHDIELTMAKRDREFQKHSLVHNQLCASRFINMWKYSFFKAKIISEQPESFEHPVKYCFTKLPRFCSVNQCENDSFIRCSHCTDEEKNCFCFHHWFTKNHYHAL